MPHYANGREAKVGDSVIGRVYNTPGIIAGTLVSLTPGVDSCNVEVEWTATAPVSFSDIEVPSNVEYVGNATPPRMHARETAMRIRGSEQHGSAGRRVALFVCRDYSAANQLLHTEDALDPQKSEFVPRARNP